MLVGNSEFLLTNALRSMVRRPACEVAVPCGIVAKTSGKHLNDMRLTLTAVFVFLCASAVTAQSQHCDAKLWNHVYHSNRLAVVKNCVTVTGTVHIVRNEPDGDTHMQLLLDPQFSNMVNAVNKTKQKGALVIEPMCTHRPRANNTPANNACANFSQRFPALTEGAHVKVTGSYVVDHDRGHGWREIHPITTAEVIE
jgi:hypothetical protein